MKSARAIPEDVNRHIITSPQANSPANHVPQQIPHSKSAEAVLDGDGENEKPLLTLVSGELPVFNSRPADNGRATDGSTMCDSHNDSHTPTKAEVLSGSNGGIIISMTGGALPQSAHPGSTSANKVPLSFTDACSVADSLSTTCRSEV